MVDKILVKNFERFRGLDYKSTPLSASLLDATQLTNYKMSEGFSIKGRPGIQVFGQAGDFVGGTTYSYFDSSTGVTRQELVAINDRMWKLSSSTLTVTRTAGTNLWDVYVLFDTTSSTFKLTVNQNGTTSVLDLGTGLEANNGTLVTVWDVYTFIDGLANFACTSPIRSAEISVTGTGNPITCTVGPGPFVAVGDTISFLNQNGNNPHLDSAFVTVVAGAAVTLAVDHTNGGAKSLSVTAGSILGPGAAPAASLDILTTTLPSIIARTDKTLTYYFWEPVYNTANFINGAAGTSILSLDAPFRDHYESRSVSGWTPASFVSASQVLYVGANSYNTIGSRGNSFAAHEGYLSKYDGQSVYRAGVPPVKRTGFNVVAAAGGALAGIYKYTFRGRFFDARGQEYIGRPYDDFFTAFSVTLGGGNNQSTITITSPRYWGADGSFTHVPAGAPTNTLTCNAGHGVVAGDLISIYDLTTALFVTRNVTSVGNVTIVFDGVGVTLAAGTGYKNPAFGFNDACAIVNGNQVNVGSSGAPLVIFNHNIRVGDTVFFIDRLTALGVTRVVTGTTATTIYWDTAVSALVNVNNTDIISKNFRVEIFRTKAGGNLFYKLAELPIASPLNTGFAYTDNAADSTLGEQMDIPAINKERDLPPRGAALCLHQGLLCISNNTDFPNSVFKSDDTTEYFPEASGGFQIPSNITSAVTAIGSDVEDRLAVFKQNAYYDVVGDLAEDQFAIRTVREGDYGISSHASLAKIDGVLIGVGPLGVLGVLNGEIVPEVGATIAPAIWNNSTINLGAAIGFNDYINRGYRLYIPALSTNLTLGYTDTGSVCLFQNYQDQLRSWFDWSYQTTGQLGLGFSGGTMIANNFVYHLTRSWAAGNPAISAVPGQFFREYRPSDFSGIQSRAYTDNHFPITYTLTTDWETLGEPSVDKQFLRLAVFSFPGTYEVRTPFTLTVTTFKDYLPLIDLIGDPADAVQSRFTLDFTTSTKNLNAYDTIKVGKIKSDKQLGILIKMVSSALQQAPLISGIQLTVAPAYIPEEPGK